jgi:hypothetical protein
MRLEARPLVGSQLVVTTQSILAQQDSEIVARHERPSLI